MSLNPSVIEQIMQQAMQGIKSRQKQEALRMYLEDTPLTKIAQDLKISPTRVMNWKVKDKWELTKQEFKEHMKKATFETSEEAALRMIKMNMAIQAKFYKELLEKPISTSDFLKAQDQEAKLRGIYKEDQTPSESDNDFIREIIKLIPEDKKKEVNKIINDRIKPA